jgi:hypothetical protein
MFVAIGVRLLARAVGLGLALGRGEVPVHKEHKPA